MATRYSDYERGSYGRSYAEEEDRSYEQRTRNFGGRSREDDGLIDRLTDEMRCWSEGEEAERRRQWAEPFSSQFPYDLSNARAADLMTRNPVVASPGDSVQWAAQRMQECDCGVLPVVDSKGRLLGMITDRDITMRLVARGADIRRTRVDDCMTDVVYACHAYDSIEGCLQTMSRHQVRRLPIVDDRDRVIGIVSQSDLAQHAATRPGRGERRAIADVLCAVSKPTGVRHR